MLAACCSAAENKEESGDSEGGEDEGEEGVEATASFPDGKGVHQLASLYALVKALSR